MAASVLRPSQVGSVFGWYKATPGDVTLVSGKVSQWNDRSGRGKHLVQATAGQRPLWIADDGDGMPAISFDGVDDLLRVDLGGNLMGGDFTVVGLLSAGAGTDTEPMSLGDASPPTVAQAFLRYAAASALVAFELEVIGGANGAPIRYGVGADCWLPFGVRKDASNVQLRADRDSSDASAATPAGTAAGSVLTVGAYNWQGGILGPFAGLWRELAVFNARLSDANLLAVVAWMRQFRNEVAPVLTFVGSTTIGPTDPVVVRGVTAIDAGAAGFDVGQFTVEVLYPPDVAGNRVCELAFATLSVDGVAPPYDAATIVDGGTAKTIELSLVRNNAWPGPSITVRAQLVDRDGVGTLAEQDYDITGGGIGAPTVGFVGSATILRADEIVIDVTNADGVAEVVLAVEGYVHPETGNQDLELAYDGALAAFLDPFSDFSYTEPIADGLRYHLARTDGWKTALGGDVAVIVTAVAPGGATRTAGRDYTVSNPDEAGPVLSSLSIPAGAETSSDAALGFHVTDISGVSSVTITAALGDGTEEPVWVAGAFVAPYASGSTSGDISDGLSFVVARAGGWPDGPLALVIFATDPLGHTSALGYSVVVNGDPAADVTRPVISNVSPAPGTALSSTSPISFDLTDDVGLADVVVLALFPGSWEVVYDRDEGFAPAYAAGSTVRPVTGGLTFVVTRTGGWPAAPTLRLRGLDSTGNGV